MQTADAYKDRARDAETERIFRDLAGGEAVDHAADEAVAGARSALHFDRRGFQEHVVVGGHQ